MVTTGSGRLAWNENVAGTWQKSEVDNNDYVLCHIFATNDITHPFFSIMGQAEYNTRGQAREGAVTEINDLVTAGLPFAEFVALGSVIFQTSNSNSNAVKGRVQTTDTGEDYVDWRTTAISPSGGLEALDHNLLAGKQGGQEGEYYHLTLAEQLVVQNTSGTNTGDQDLSALALKSNVLELDNTTPFTPDADYEPATKKYVDDNSGGVVDISCKVKKTSNQTITDSVFTIITWDDEEYDTDGMHSNVTNNSRITIQTAGKYHVTAQSAWEATNNGLRVLEIMVDGNRAGRNRAGGEFYQDTVSWTGELSVGQYVELRVYQSCGGNLEFRNFEEVSSYLEAHKIN